VVAAVEVAGKKVDALIADNDTAVLEFDAFGKKSIQEAKLSPDGLRAASGGGCPNFFSSFTHKHKEHPITGVRDHLGIGRAVTFFFFVFVSVLPFPCC
jgi:hypothetical protein